MNKRKSYGFILLEVLIVIAILSLLVGITIPRLSGLKKMVEKRVCDANRMTALRQYEVFLIGKLHSDGKFQMFLIEYIAEACPNGGEYFYDKGRVECEFHVENDDDEPLDDEVPWL